MRLCLASGILYRFDGCTVWMPIGNEAARLLKAAQSGPGGGSCDAISLTRIVAEHIQVPLQRELPVAG